MCFGKVRFQFQCAAIGVYRLVQFSLGFESVAQVAMEAWFRSVQYDCPQDVLDGNLVLPHLGGDDSEQMQGIGMIRINGEDLPVKLLSSLKLPGLMMLDGNRESFGNRCHRVHSGSEMCVTAIAFLFGVDLFAGFAMVAK